MHLLYLYMSLYVDIGYVYTQSSVVFIREYTSEL